jgi:hypothetical protein
MKPMTPINPTAAQASPIIMVHAGVADIWPPMLYSFVLDEPNSQNTITMTTNTRKMPTQMSSGIPIAINWIPQ